MKSYRVLFAIGVACIGISLSVESMWSQGHTTPIQKVINRTKSLEVFGLKKDGSEVKLILKNNYNKNITAFSLSVGSYGITRDLSDNGHLIAPGASYVQSCTIARSAAEPVITILSVIFEDGGSDGDAYAARGVLERRLGHRTQLAHVLEHLSKAQQSSDNNLSVALNAAKMAIMHLPVRVQGNPSHHFEAGLHEAKEEALLEFEGLERLTQHHANAAARLRLTEITDNYRKRVARL